MIGCRLACTGIVALVALPSFFRSLDGHKLHSQTRHDRHKGSKFQLSLIRVRVANLFVTCSQVLIITMAFELCYG